MFEYFFGTATAGSCSGVPLEVGYIEVEFILNWNCRLLLQKRIVDIG